MFYSPAAKIGDRIEITPSHDMWMRGDRYGLVVSVRWSLADGPTGYVVKMDKSGRALRIAPDGIQQILEV